jgi:hypothetical protein
MTRAIPWDCEQGNSKKALVGPGVTVLPDPQARRGAAPLRPQCLLVQQAVQPRR